MIYSPVIRAHFYEMELHFILFFEKKLNATFNAIFVSVKY